MVNISIDMGRGVDTQRVAVSDAIFWRLLQMLDTRTITKLKHVERAHIERALSNGDMTQQAIADRLGISKPTLYNKRKKYQLN